MTTPTAPRYDVVVVGAGHNGLAAAAYLARAGRSVLVLERSADVGGASVSARVFDGVDVRLSRYSYLVSLLPRAVRDELGLRVELRRRRFSSFTPDPEDPARGLLVDTQDPRATARSFAAVGAARDFAAWQGFYARTTALAGRLFPTLTAPLPGRDEARELIGPEDWRDFVERPLGELVEETFASDLVRGVVLTDGLIGTFARVGDVDGLLARYPKAQVRNFDGVLDDMFFLSDVGSDAHPGVGDDYGTVYLRNKKETDMRKQFSVSYSRFAIQDRFEHVGGADEPFHNGVGLSLTYQTNGQVACLDIVRLLDDFVFFGVDSTTVASVNDFVAVADKYRIDDTQCSCFINGEQNIIVLSGSDGDASRSRCDYFFIHEIERLYHRLLPALSPLCFVVLMTRFHLIPVGISTQVLAAASIKDLKNVLYDPCTSIVMQSFISK